jgi:hypothetical protein
VGGPLPIMYNVNSSLLDDLMHNYALISPFKHTEDVMEVEFLVADGGSGQSNKNTEASMLPPMECRSKVQVDPNVGSNARHSIQ